VESLSNYVAPAGLRQYYQDAEAMLGPTPDPDTEDRLGQCARKILAMSDSTELEARPVVSVSTIQVTEVSQPETESVDDNSKPAVGSLEAEVMRYEGELIQRALESVGGSVTRAARLLGITHQGLAFILNGRHQSLLTVRTPIRRRRKSIFRA
jgi:DNA-binding NtrC family response regulator